MATHLENAESTITCQQKVQHQCYNIVQSRWNFISGGIAHIGDGTIIENSTIIIENGKIIAIEDSDLVIINKDRGLFYDITGKHVYPSFILPNSTLGLVEIDAVRATRDEREVGDLNPLELRRNLPQK